MRDIKPRPASAQRQLFFGTGEKSPVLVTTKPGEDGGWVALRLQNLTARKAGHADRDLHRQPGSGTQRRSDRASRRGD
jgi:hypothetical protein